MLSVRALEVAYGDFQVLWGVSLEVGAEEIVCLLGPNGAGKSTIMNAITGLVPRFAGSVAFQGRTLPRCRRMTWSGAALRTCSSGGGFSPR